MEKIETAQIDSPVKNWEECVAKYPELVERRNTCRKFGLYSAIAIFILFTLFLGLVGTLLSIIPALVIGNMVYLFSLAFSIPKCDRGFMIVKNPKTNGSKLASWNFSNNVNTFYNRPN